MSQALTNEERLSRNTEYMKNPETRAALFQQFSPTFCYHADEQSFPLHPDAFVKNVIEAKYDEYTNIQQRQKRGLTDLEQKELKVIEKYFWKDNAFNPDYKKHENESDFQEMIQRQPDDSNSKFLVFDEKKYGYKVGEKIDIVGIAPQGHSKYDAQKASAPIAASIIATTDGFFIQYESTYSLNNAIKGTRWLRDLLPSNLADKADNFGFHYGDCEGVGVYVNVDDQGKASLKSLQTFAHGRDGAREVNAKDCTFENGKICVYVGLGGHPSYADNFVGRNKFADVVGDTYKITPTTFIDTSPDKVAEKSQDIPASLSTFPRLADSNPMIHSGTSHPKNATELKSQSQEWHRYNPMLGLTKVWNKIKSSFQSLLGHKKDKQAPLFDLKVYVDKKSQSATTAVEREKTNEKAVATEISRPKSWATNAQKEREQKRLSLPGDIQI